MAKRANDPALRWLPPLAAVILASVAVAILYLAQVIFMPLALGIILAFLLQPLVKLLERLGIWRVPAVIAVVAMVSVVLAGIVVSVGGQLGRLAHELRTNQTYISNLESKATDLRGLGGGGPLADLQATMDRVGSNLESPETEPVPETTVLVREETPSALNDVLSTLSPLLEPLGTAALVVVLVIFMLISREDLRNRIISVIGHGQLSVTTRALDVVGQRIGRYLMMQFVINASYGIALGVVLFFVGVPFAALWGLMAALLRYIPYVGPWLGAIFPIVTSLVAFEGWTQPFVVIAFIVGIELFSNMVMEPVLLGHSVGISAVGLIMAAGFWTLLWGPIGLVMATPLTVCLVVVGRHVPQFRFFAELLGDEPVLLPAVRYYQRLFARDQQEAADLVQEHLQASQPLSHPADQVLLPALVRTRKDRCREQITAEDEGFILKATREIVRQWDQPRPDCKVGLLQRWGVGATPKQTSNGTAAENRSPSPVDVAGEAAGKALPETTASQPVPRVLAYPSHHEAEEVAIEILSATMREQGYEFQSLTTRALPTDVITAIREQQPSVFFLAVIPPSGFSQASYLCRRLRKTFPELPIIVGYWGPKSRFDEALVKLRSRGASFMTTSIAQTQKQIAALAEIAPKTVPPAPERSPVHATDTDD